MINIINIRGYNPKSLHDLNLSKEYVLELPRYIKKGQKISILSDTMLKAMFQNENRLKYSAKFLSYFIDLDYEVILKNIYLAKNELDKEKESSKGERCDYVAVIDNTSLNIEVNNNSSLEILERNIEYAYRLYSKKIKRGEREYDYTQVIQFNLNNFSFKGNDKIIDIYGVKNDSDLTLSDKIIFVQIYVPNLRKKWYNEGIESLNEAEKYILALVEMDIEKLKSLGGEELMEEYVKEAEEVSFEGGVGESYDKEWALKDQAYRDGEEAGEKKGKEEGRKEGLEEGSTTKAIEIARNLLKNKIDISIIAQSTGLSIDEINSL